MERNGNHKRMTKITLLAKSKERRTEVGLISILPSLFSKFQFNEKAGEESKHGIQGDQRNKIRSSLLRKLEQGCKWGYPRLM